MASGSPFTSQTLAGLSTTLGGHPAPILWLPHQGLVEERSGNAPLMLDDPEVVFFVEGGSADVFSVPSAPGNGQPGARRFLWTAMEGDVLFGFPSQAVVGPAHVLMAVCAPGSRLRRMPFAEVEARAREEEWVFVALIEGLAARLAGALVLRPELHVVLKPGETVTLERGKIAGTVSGLVWVRPEAGQSRFSGMAEVLLAPHDPPLPLCKGMWLEALSEEVSLTTVDTATCVASGHAFPGLGRLRSLFGVVVARIAELEEQAERERLERKAASETEMRSRALTGLVTVLEGAGLEAAVGEAKEPLLRACRVVGARDAISFRAPP